MYFHSKPKAVDNHLIRGGRPINRASVEELADIGVDTIICLLQPGRHYRAEITGVESERKVVEDVGMRFIHIPMDEAHYPSGQDIKTFVEIARHGRVYAHCSKGVDRVGLMVALYELEVMSKTYEEVYTNYLRSGHDFITWQNLDLFLFEYAKKKIGDHIDPWNAIVATVKHRPTRKVLYDYLTDNLIK